MITDNERLERQIAEFRRRDQEIKEQYEADAKERRELLDKIFAAVANQQRGESA
jgi:hypothetical protein